MKKINYIIIALLAHIPIFSSHDIKEKLAKDAQAQIAGLGEPNLPDDIKVKTKDNKIIPLPKVLINVFELVKTALENDKDAKEIPLPSVTSQAYNLIVIVLYDPKGQALNNLKQITYHVNQLVNEKNINTVYHAADYLGVNKQNPLFKVLAKRYAQLIHENLEAFTKGPRPQLDLIAQAKSLVNAKYYLPEIANQYFLLYVDDIDQKLDTASKPTIQELQEHGLLQEDIIKEFPNLEKNPNATNKSGSFPLDYYAIDDLNMKSIKSLLKLGAKPILRHLNMLDIPTADFLIKAGAPLDRIDHRDKGTPLMEAARIGDPKWIKYLIEKGAQVNIPRADGKTALDIALDYLKLVEENPMVTGRTLPPLHKKAFENSIQQRNEIIAILKKAGAREGKTLSK